MIKMTAMQALDELAYINYKHNRLLSPHVTPERWGKIYSGAENLEARFQKDLKTQGKVPLSTQTIEITDDKNSLM